MVSALVLGEGRRSSNFFMLQILVIAPLCGSPVTSSCATFPMIGS